MAVSRVRSQPGRVPGEHEIIFEEGNVIKVVTLTDAGVMNTRDVVNYIIYGPETERRPELSRAGGTQGRC